MQSASVLIVFVLALSGVLALDVSLDQHWKLWREKHNKRYIDDEEHVRRTIWESNLKKVQEHNLQADLGVHTHWLGMNRYADMTIDEFVKVMNGFNVEMQKQRNEHRGTFTFNPNVKLPDNVDWREKGLVTPIKDQGQCGSCWAFSATGSVEGLHAKVTGQLIQLSEQQLMDCSTKEGNMGCNGGLMDQAFKYLMTVEGLESEADYPYGASGGKCKYDPSKAVANISGYIDITSKDENALQQAVATVGPVSIAIDAGHSSFQLYKSGVYSERSCSQTQLDHGVLAVGYGTESGTDYWLVKNSWGTAWGKEGYILMTRNKKNQCGIATMASYPTV